MTQRFDIKDPGESIELEFDFENGLAADETLVSTPVIEVRVALGVDPTPLAILNGSGQFNATAKRAIVPITGGLAGVDYDIKVSCSTSNPKKILVWNGILPVRAR